MISDTHNTPFCKERQGSSMEDPFRKICVGLRFVMIRSTRGVQYVALQCILIHVYPFAPIKEVGSAAWQGLTANVDANAQLALQGMMQYAQEMRAKPPREE